MCLCHIIFWNRYTDDAFMIKDHRESLLKAFLRIVNSNTFNLGFTVLCDKILFLTTEINICRDITLGSKLFCKETAEITILHTANAHLQLLVKSVYQYLWIRRTCSDDINFK